MLEIRLAFLKNLTPNPTLENGITQAQAPVYTVLENGGINRGIQPYSSGIPLYVNKPFIVFVRALEQQPGRTPQATAR